MSAPLATYLHDHLAGSKLAVDLLGTLREDHAGAPLATFAAQLLVDIEEDRAVLEELVERIGRPDSALLKEGIVWLGEQGVRLKLRQTADGLGTLETLEMLALGILGKLSLWRALAHVGDGHPRLRDIDIARLVERAHDQHARVEKQRLEAARQIFTLPSAGRPE